MCHAIVLVAMVVMGGAIDQDPWRVAPLAVTRQLLGTTDDQAEMPYYVFELPTVEVPGGMALAEAYLTFLVDASSSVEPESIGGRIPFEVYPEIGLANGRLDVSELGPALMTRTVPIGSNKTVRIYITDFVQRTIENPTMNRHMIAGSFVGQRIGSFEVRTLPTVGASASLSVSFTRIEIPPLRASPNE